MSHLFQLISHMTNYQINSNTIFPASGDNYVSINYSRCNVLVKCLKKKQRQFIFNDTYAIVSQKIEFQNTYRFHKFVVLLQNTNKISLSFSYVSLKSIIFCDKDTKFPWQSNSKQFQFSHNEENTVTNRLQGDTIFDTIINNYYTVSYFHQFPLVWHCVLITFWPVWHQGRHQQKPSYPLAEKEIIAMMVVVTCHVLITSQGMPHGFNPNQETTNSTLM